MAFSNWVEGARLRTLPAAVAPVVLGTFVAYSYGSGSIPRALLAAGVALALQIGVNFANDYSDGIRGTDDHRVGPPRLTGGGAASPRTVKLAAFAFFGLAGVLGLVLVALSGHWWLIAVGIAAVIAAWYYTGGKNPYGYMGLGEVFVFIFFGLVATLGTTVTQADRVDVVAWVGAIGIGLIACAILMVNNLRDIPTDTISGKKTLAVRIGDKKARLSFLALLALPLILATFLVPLHPWIAVVNILWVAVAVIYRPVHNGATGLALIPPLKLTGLYEIAYALVFGIAVLL